MTTEQENAAHWLWSNNEKKYLQLVAGAGSGKTTTMVETLSVAKEAGFNPSSCCLITFTKKSANEMEQRLLKNNIRAGFTGTMHSLGYSILKNKYGGALNILTDSDKVIKDIICTLFPQYRHIPPDVLSKSNLLSHVEKERLQKEYFLYKQKKDLFDLDDLIHRARSVLESSSDLFPYEYVMVDEFQDTSPEQVSFIQSMRPGKLFAVGDDWQSIYGFRGADVSISRNFSQYFPGARRSFLTKNFRSQGRIVQLGNKAIRLSEEYIKKKLRAHHSSTVAPRCFIISKKVSPEKAWSLYAKVKNEISNLTVLVRTNYLRTIIEEIAPAGVNVLTIHSSKGLEFENVLIFGVAKNIFPHRFNDPDEEVRLLYVAITRAKQQIDFLCWEDGSDYSSFMPFLASNCKITYLKESGRGLKQTG
ncbi:MAG: UvrD-helicase domain-containing protein [Leptospirales bacterium]